MIDAKTVYVIEGDGPETWRVEEYEAPPALTKRFVQYEGGRVLDTWHDKPTSNLPAANARIVELATAERERCLERANACDAVIDRVKGSAE